MLYRLKLLSDMSDIRALYQEDTTICILFKLRPGVNEVAATA
jgi:hypothetical protein